MITNRQQVDKLDIMGLPNNWLITGCPQRAEYIAHRVFGGAKKPIFNDGFMSIWLFRLNGKNYGVLSHGMGRPSIDYALRRLSQSTELHNVVRVGTAGGYSDEFIEEIVCCTEAINLEHGTYSHVEFNTSNTNVLKAKCVSTDFFYKDYNTIDFTLGDVEDMETSTLFEIANEKKFKALSILFVVNKIGCIGQQYNIKVHDDMANLAIELINFNLIG